MFSFEAFDFAAGQYKKIFGRSLSPVCNFLYEELFSNVTKDFWDHTNFSVPFGTCPIPSQTIFVRDWTPNDLGDYLPTYIPGGDRWKLADWLSRNGTNIAGIAVYSILRDNQKLFDSKFG